MNTLSDESAHALSYAIVMQAVADWLSIASGDYIPCTSLDDLRKFFNSSYCASLCGSKHLAQAILDKLESENPQQFRRAYKCKKTYDVI